jgi:hypothetical protein
MNNPTYLPKIKRLYINALRVYEHKHFSVMSVAFFVLVWLTLGNAISVLYSLGITVFTEKYNFTYLLIYIFSVSLVFMSLYKEISSIASKPAKVIIWSQIVIFLTFVYAPPRHADSMRVWLGKIFDIILNSEKILRPYTHYHTPDAFTLFHLPIIQIGDGQLFQLSIYTCFISILIMLIKICSYYNNEYITISTLLLFIFNPLIVLGATVIISDMPIILSVAGIIYSIILFNYNPKFALILSALFLVFGMNIKYNMLMFIPAYITWIIINRKRFSNNYSISFYFLITILFVLAIYPYALNYYNIGNPVWPALNNVFPAKLSNWDIVAITLTDGFLNNSKSFYNLIISFYNLITMPYHINPIVIMLSLFLFQRFKYVSYMPIIFVLSYLIILFIMMPRFAENEKERYILYLFPLIIPFGIIGFSNYFNKYMTKHIQKMVYAVVLVPSAVYLTFNIYYAKDAIQYLIYNDDNKWHKHTWYFNEYQWMNKNTQLQKSQQIMLWVSAQTTYYLKQKYINIDSLSGYFKDPIIFESSLNFVNELKKFNIAYVFVDADVLDEQSKIMLKKLVANGSLHIIRISNTYISASRMLDRGIMHKTILYEVNYKVL